MSNCNLLHCNLQPVGVCAATALPGCVVGGAGVGCCGGTPTVTVTAAQGGSIWPWVIGIAGLLWLVSRGHRHT